MMVRVQYMNDSCALILNEHGQRSYSSFFPRLSLIFFFFFFLGITRLPVLEGEVSHVEIPRTSPSLGITIVGGADTPLVSSPFLIKF